MIGFRNSKMVRIADVARTTSGTTPPRGRDEYWTPPKYPWVKTGEIAFTPITNTEEAVSEKAVRECSLSLLPPGTVLVAMYGQGKTRGQSAVLSVEATINQACFAILPNESFDSEYLQFWFRRCYQLLRDLSNSRGGNQANLNAAILNTFRAPLVEREIQQQVVSSIKARLAEVEKAQQAALSIKCESRALYNSIYKAAFHRTVPITVPPTFADPPKGWSWVKLGKVASLESGHTPSRDRPDWWGGDVSWLSLTEIRKLDGQWVEETELRTNAAGIANSSARILPEGTVCFSRTASVGFVAIMKKPMATSQDFANWVCSDDLNPEFLMHALTASRAYVRELATGATHKTIYMPTLKAFYICMPDRPTQDKIAAKLREQFAAQREIEKGAVEMLCDIDSLPTRILAQAFEV